MSPLAKFTLAGLAAFASLGVGVDLARAQSANSLVGWQCKTSQPVGWCPVTSSTPLPVESAYSYSRKTADGQVKASAGFVHTVTISPTGAVVAGVLTLYDSTAESGTVIMSISLPVTTFTPFSITIDATAGTGLYVGFDGTLANVQATVTYR